MPLARRGRQAPSCASPAIHRFAKGRTDRVRLPFPGSPGRVAGTGEGQFPYQSPAREVVPIIAAERPPGHAPPADGPPIRAIPRHYEPMPAKVRHCQLRDGACQDAFRGGDDSATRPLGNLHVTGWAGGVLGEGVAGRSGFCNIRVTRETSIRSHSAGRGPRPLSYPFVPAPQSCPRRGLRPSSGALRATWPDLSGGSLTNPGIGRQFHIPVAEIRTLRRGPSVARALRLLIGG